MSAPTSTGTAGALEPARLAEATQAALAAITAATDLDVLAAVRTAHVDGRSAPLVLARRELGNLPRADRAEAGQRHNAAVQSVRAAYETRLAELTAERDARVLVEERIDVTLPVDRRRRGARHPITMLSERLVDVFAAM